MERSLGSPCLGGASLVAPRTSPSESEVAPESDPAAETGAAAEAAPADLWLGLGRGGILEGDCDEPWWAASTSPSEAFDADPDAAAASASASSSAGRFGAMRRGLGGRPRVGGYVPRVVVAPPMSNTMFFAVLAIMFFTIFLICF
ncbi:hypothetical protein GUJ93_ZPchr0004g38635 [Zizania palustris]|uniref:Uncharacterized protein n=1 Tax=Zizania palustris TaxID=103762 RepID=A0A8J5VNI0_ZIZPA|nr:hypothetical protein GUJ93_ZPchr0004g38635 [Zizania palustris]